MNKLFTRGLLTFALIMFVSLIGYSQTKVSGVVTGSDGDALIGANVLEKGTSSGTVTDIDGSYSLTVASGATLTFSYTGYADQEVVVGTQSTINVTLEEGTLLDEVVVTGYGSLKSREVTSSIVQVKAEDFNKGNVNDATSLLQGKVPGLSIYNKGGDPNSTPVIRLRGISTVGANSEPLVVVDGVIGASLDNVDPNDIESINVLKDGSAAAIYGSRGSSGVILVTTKSGTRGGGITATYNGYVASASVARNQPVMTAAEYTAAGGNDLGSVTDWQGEVTQTAMSNVHNIAVAGGTKNTTFRLSTNFRNVEGVLRNSEFSQINARANVNHYALNDKLNINFNMSLTNRESNFSFNEALRYATLFNPTAPIRNTSGGYFQAILFDNFNPVAIIEQNQNLGTRRNLNFNTQLSYELFEGLTLTGNYGQQYTSQLNGEFYPGESLFRGYNRGALAKRYTSDQTFTLLETYATYAKSMNKIDLTVTAGYSWQETQFQDLYVEVGNFPTDNLGFNILESGGDLINGTASGLNVSSSASPKDRIIGMFGRANLTFDEAITVNASVRREGSTKLGKDNQWGVFPAFGVGVDINKYANINSFDALKLRVGYGVTGSLPRDSGLSQDLYSYSFGGGGTVSFDRAGNPDLKWEQKAETNLGIDFALLDYKLTGSLDLYTRDINDFILERTVESSIYGTDRRVENGGKLNTKGIELALGYKGIGNDNFSWSPNVVLSSYSTTLVEFLIDEEVRANLGAPGQNGTNMIRVAVGEEIGQIWGPVFEGVAEDGTPVFADLNGDGQVIADQGSALLEDGDFEQLGSGIPSLELGWNNTFTMGNWDLNAFFRGAFGHSLVNTFRAFYEPIDPGAINSYNRIKTDLQEPTLTSAQFSSLYVEKADFLRLDNVTLGYNFDVSKTTSVQKVRAYASVQNAFTITNYQGIDPDPALQDFGPVDNGNTLDTSNPDVLSPGIDRRNNYFTARTFTVGINVVF